jgi:hypothetical protein
LDVCGVFWFSSSTECQQSHWKSGHKDKCKNVGVLNSPQNGTTNGGFKASAAVGKSSNLIALVPSGCGISRPIKKPKDVIFLLFKFLIVLIMFCYYLVLLKAKGEVLGGFNRCQKAHTLKWRNSTLLLNSTLLSTNFVLFRFFFLMMNLLNYLTGTNQDFLLVDSWIVETGLPFSQPSFSFIICYHC